MEPLAGRRLPCRPFVLEDGMALQLLREHKRGLAGVRKPGRMPAAATNAEVIEALTKRLSAFGVHAGKGGKRK
jgi:hypothetical protein